MGKEKGLKVVIATGRPISGMRSYLKLLNLMEDDYVISVFDETVVQENKSSAITEKRVLH